MSLQSALLGIPDEEQDQPAPETTPTTESYQARDTYASEPRDIAPDIVRFIPSEAIAADDRNSQADDWAAEQRSALADKWAETQRAALPQPTGDTDMGVPGVTEAGPPTDLQLALPHQPVSETPEPQFGEGELSQGQPSRWADPARYLRDWIAQGAENTLERGPLIGPAQSLLQALNDMTNAVAGGLPGGETGLGQAVYGMALLPPPAKMEAAAEAATRVAAEAPGATLPALNALITTFGGKLKATDAWEAQRITAGLDVSVAALAHHIGDGLKQFKLSGDEMDAVVDLLEQGARPFAQVDMGLRPLATETGTAVGSAAGGLLPRAETLDEMLPLMRPARAVSDKARQVATLLRETFDNVIETAQDAGVTQGYLENFFAHLVRKPAAEAKVNPDFTSNELSAWTQSAMARLRDEAGNIRFPTIGDLEAHLAEAHPDWQVIKDIPTVAEAHVRGMITAANHSQLVDTIKGLMVENADKPGEMLSALSSGLKQPASNFVKVDLPDSLARWVAKGTPIWAEKDTAEALNRYLHSTLPTPAGLQNAVAQTGIKAYLALSAGMVRGTLMNLMVHGDNLISSAMGQYVNPGQAAGIGSDLAYARRFLSDPVFQVQEMQAGAGQLNLRMMADFANDLRSRAGAIPKESGLLTDVGSTASAPFRWLMDKEQSMLFNSLGQRLQIMNYAGNLRAGMKEEEAASVANALFGQFTTRDRGQIANMILKYGALAPNWSTGNLIRLSSTFLPGRPGALSGYAANLSPESRKVVANAIRQNTVQGASAAVMTTALLNRALSGHWSWDGNEPGRLLEVDTGLKNANGDTIYLPSPYFRHQQDYFRIGAGAVAMGQEIAGTSPGEKISTRVGTSGLDTILGKANPIIQAGRDVVSGTQFPGGPPIINTTDPVGKVVQALSFAANRAAPPWFQTQAQKTPPQGADEFRAAPGSENLSVTGAGGAGWTDRSGFHGPSDPEAQKIGAVAEALGGRTSVGPSFRGAGNEAEQQKAKAAFESTKFSAPTQLMFHEAGLNPSAAVTGAPVPVGSTHMMLTRAEEKPFQEQVRVNLDAAVDRFMERHGPQGDNRWAALPPAEKQRIVREMDTEAQRQATAALGLRLKASGELRDRVKAAQQYNQDRVGNMIERFSP